MRPLFLKWHLGLGDAIICNGLVRVLAKQFPVVMIPAKPHNRLAVSWMFSDLPNIIVVEVKDDQDMQMLSRKKVDYEAAGIGLFSDRGLQRTNWDRAFYEDCLIDFECRWNEFNLPWKTLLAFTPHWPVFIHDDPSRSYCLAIAVPQSCIYMPSENQPFKNHIRPLQSADEIHVIDSCFLCLADSIETNAKRHVLHAYATAHDPYKKLGPPTLRKDWEILR